MIVGTAGHIDHGKTTLVRALTGVDTDRLPQEKARGISIELGYAFLDVPGSDARIGFIDVPGHERLVHTMLAGATGIDQALLLVAANDGVMPQTREHLAVLSLLGLSRGAIVVTKVDRADAARMAQVEADIAALLVGTPLAAAPLFRVSATTGQGIAGLREHLFDTARATPARHAAGAAFRLAIDRAFTLAGIGTVVTGTVHAGRVRIGDALSLTSSTVDRPVRVRSLHAQNQVVAEAHAGQRCAVALTGVVKDDVRRGQWLTAPEVALATDRIDARLTLWHDEPRALRSGTPVHVHIGASDALGSVAVMQLLGPDEAADALPPGREAYVQIVLREPVAAWHGDRVVLRDTSASRTIAGGSVLDPFAPARYRRTPQRLAELAAWSLPSARERLQALVDGAPGGVSRSRWLRAEGLAEGSTEAEAPPAEHRHGDMLLGPLHLAALMDATRAALRRFHAHQPDMLGPDAARLRRLAAPRIAEALWHSLLARMQRDGLVVVREAFVHLPEHGLHLSASDERMAQKIAPHLAAAGFEGRWVRDLARDCDEGEAPMRTALARLAQHGELHQVVKDLYCAPRAMAQLAAHARAVADDAGAVTAARFRDVTGLGRKRAIQILEYFDRIGLLRRVGDEHRVRRESSLFSTGAQARH